MSLFGNDSGLTPKEDMKVSLAQIAGGAAGVGAGVLSSIPLDAKYQEKLVEQGSRLTRDKDIAEKNWRILLQLFKRTLTLEDLPAEQREFYAKQMEEHAETLKHLARNPQEAMRSFQDLQGGKVVPLFPGAEQAKMKGLFPHKVRSPLSSILPGALGLAGMVGAGAAAKNHYSKEDEE